MKNSNPEILLQSVKYLKSVGPKRAESFKKIGIETIKDLLFYFPSRYLDRTTVLNSAKVYGYVVNGYEGEVTIIGKVVDKEKINYGKKEILKIHMRDSAGFFECVWFQGARMFQRHFNEGEVYAISTRPVLTKYGNLQFIHPDFDKISEDESQKFLNTGKIIPFYRIAKELRTTNLGDLSLRKIIANIVENYSENLGETLTGDIISAHNLMGITEAVKNMHFPETKEKLDQAITRFKFEELFYIEILVALRKYYFKDSLSGYSMKVRSSLVSDFLKSLPYELTRSQLKVLSEIRKDLESTKPMNRLLQGDVGSGKTIVALISMLIAKDNGFQSAFMAPTEILADQHYKNLSRLLKNTDVNVKLLIGSQKKSEKKKNIEEIQLNGSDIIIGTHALLEENVGFNKLGLVIIDEQHRFGVLQRSKLITKGSSPDVIVMTATPIPRTLSMTVYGDLDISTIDEMPKNRKPVKTYLRGENKLPNIYRFIVDKCREGYQSFIVYPLVKESDKLELKDAESHFDLLQKTYLKEIKIGMIHGQMTWQEKEEMMQRFAQKEFDTLIATTVIEVGIDIPDANIIIINDAHRFGLSQLHQLRGRVGRSDKQAYCLLVTKDEYADIAERYHLDFEYMSSSQIEKNKTIARLQSMVTYPNGFDIAEIDLKLRGPGDIFGTKQSGLPELKFADIGSDQELIVKAKTAAFEIIDNDPLLKNHNNMILKTNLEEKYRSNFLFSKIA
jgi:ATP-dependent DNA helicase RecG